MNVKHIISIMFLIMLVSPIYADWVVSTQGDPGVLVMDENGYAYWGDVNVTLSSTNFEKTYDTIDTNHIYSKWLFGMLAILVGLFLFVGTFFNLKIREYI
jgi:hypothetical protein